ncbi:MAG: IS21-like element helper ATPase IstB [Candidatus Thiodiazotropha sp. (ex Lucinoma borealis)]|nr:IS21-like element helper ATPase IstB [Candidatus Thiodiazotropha sp. (ex Lucinoma borealis)]
MTTLIEQTLTNLRSLRLTAMAQAFEDMRSNASLQDLSCDDRLGMAVDIEIQERQTKKLKRMVKSAKFKIDASPEDINYRVKRGLDRQVMSNLMSCDYLEKHLNVVLTGPTGVGKTWLACALGHQATRRGYSVYYVRLSRLLEELEIAHADGSLPTVRNRLSKKDLLILDDWALSPLTSTGRQELLEIIDDRLGKGSIMITSQLPVEQWHVYLGEATIADAILDRIVHAAHILKLNGESMRKRMSPIKSVQSADKEDDND